MPCLIQEQGLQQLQFLGRHLRSPTSPLRSLFQIGIEWFRILSGYTTCPLARPQLATHHVELAPWFCSVQKFLSTINHSLEIPNLFQLRPLREHDQAIMHLPQQHFTPHDLRCINRCRLFLQVSTIAEVSTTDGKHLHPSTWRGQPPTHSVSKLLWPRQARPSAYSWRTWRRFLSQALLPGNYNCYSTHLPLRQPLGTWFTHYMEERQWLWFYCPSSSAFL